MNVRFIARAIGAAAIACVVLQGASIEAARAQQPPTAAAIGLAAQLLEIKGGLAAFDPAVDGVIISHRNTLLQINPNLAKDIDAVVVMMRADSPARRKEMQTEIAKGYASAFSEQDLRDIIVFYKTPLGKKMVENEPKAGEESTSRAAAWIEKYAEAMMQRMRAEMKKKGHTEF
ncbi:MAG: DUF2059 domain-containing protein [Alphaproteobacteria bacterium]|nr:DUF2059 domain-containing protein [Alphaproteobacteria bacterium]